MMEHAIFFAGVLLLCVLSIKAGFGPVLLPLPLLISLFGPHLAVPMVAAATLAVTLPRLPATAAVIRWRLVARYLLGAAPGCAAGALLFSVLPREAVNRMIGLLFLGFVLYRRSAPSQAESATSSLLFRGLLSGAASGVAGSSSVLETPLFRRPAPGRPWADVSQVASAAVVNSIKLLIYQRFLEFDWRFWRVTALVAVAMLLASRLAGTAGYPEHETPRLRRIVEFCLIVAAAYLLVHGTAP